MVRKKNSGWNLQDMQDTLVKDTEQKISDGFEEIRQEQDGDGAAVASSAPQHGQTVNDQSTADQQAPALRRMYHKERTQDVLVHCPVSLHRRLTELKNHRWEEYGERVTINNMIVEAIAQWLVNTTI